VFSSLFDITPKDVFACKLKGDPIRVNAFEYSGVGIYRYNKSFQSLIDTAMIKHAPFAPESDVYEVMYPIRVLSVVPVETPQHSHPFTDYSFMHGQRYEVGDVIRIKDGAVWDSK